MPEYPKKLYRPPNFGKFDPKIHYRIAKDQHDELFWRSQKYRDLEYVLREIRFKRENASFIETTKRYSMWLFFALAYAFIVLSWLTAKYLGYM